MTFSLSFNPVWSFVDLNGLQLDDTYYLFTLQNELPYLFQPIYKDQDATIPWSDPIQFLANGTLPINMYWDDTIVYRLEVRKGNTQSDPLIYPIENYTPIGESLTPVSSTNSSTNQVTNPEFSNVNFTGTLITSTTSIIPIAPGWQIVTSGAGTLTIVQEAFAGVDQLPGNPAYGISIANNGFSSVTLQQTFNQNGALWTGEDVAVTLDARSDSGSTGIAVSLVYSDASNEAILTATTTGNWAKYKGVSHPGVSSNPNIPPAAYTNLNFRWNGNVIVHITNIQLTSGPSISALVDIPYEQTTIEQQTNGEFWYYNPQLQYKPIPYYTIGWDFKFNPCQERGVSGGPYTLGGINRTLYIADQTLLFQSVDNTLSFAVADIDGLSIIDHTTASSFALIQYLDSATALELLNQRDAVMVRGKMSTGAMTGQVHLLWTAAGTPFVPALPASCLLLVDPITGNPTLEGTWNEVARSNLGTAIFPLTTTSTSFNFNGWDATQTAGINTATAFAVVLTFPALPVASQMKMQFCTLCAGDIATPPGALNRAQTLDALQYYYETSYDYRMAVGTTSAVGALLLPQTVGEDTGHTVMYAKSFGFEFKSIKRVDLSAISSPASFYLYNPSSGSVNQVLATANSSDSTGATGNPSFTSNWASTIGQKGLWASPTTNAIQATYSVAGVTATSEAFIQFHYVCDARFGNV